MRDDEGTRWQALAAQRDDAAPPPPPKPAPPLPNVTPPWQGSPGLELVGHPGLYFPPSSPVAWLVVCEVERRCPGSP